MYDETAPCEICGEAHERTSAEIYFAEECERRGLPSDPALIPDKVKHVINAASEMIGVLALVFAAEPGLMQYYAAALTATSRVAEDHSDLVFAAISKLVFGEDGPTAPDWEG